MPRWPELVHNFFLVHDEVMDGAHHPPTVWRVFSVDQAVPAGDVMLALATRLLAESADGTTAVEWLGASTVRLCEGQFAYLVSSGGRRSTCRPALRWSRTRPPR